MALALKTGVVIGSSTIETGLSSIDLFVLYRNTKTSSGVVVGSYHKELGAHYTGLSISTYLSTIGSNTVSPTINDGTVTWNGEGSLAMASKEEYTWIAFGEE